MTKQEEIREGMRDIPTNIMEGWGTVNTIHLSDKLIELIFRYLDSQGAVLKVERTRLLKYDNYNDLTRELDSRFEIVAVEPLIKEVKDVNR